MCEKEDTSKTNMTIIKEDLLRGCGKYHNHCICNFSSTTSLNIMCDIKNCIDNDGFELEQYVKCIKNVTQYQYKYCRPNAYKKNIFHVYAFETDYNNLKPKWLAHGDSIFGNYEEGQDGINIAFLDVSEICLIYIIADNDYLCTYLDSGTITDQDSTDIFYIVYPKNKLSNYSEYSLIDIINNIILPDVENMIGINGGKNIKAGN